MSLLLLITTSLLTTSPAPLFTAEPEPAWLAPRPLLAPLPLQDASEAHAHTQNSYYLRLTGGLVTTQNSDGPGEEIDFDEGYLLSVGIGHRFGASETGLGFGLELDGIWTDQDASSSGTLQAVRDVNVAGALLNGVVDFRIADRFTVYGAGGLGVAWLDVGTSSDSLNDFSDEDGPFLAWQLKAGVAWSFTDDLALHFGYRFLNIDDAQIDDGIGDSSFDLQTQQHVLEIGLIFGF